MVSIVLYKPQIPPNTGNIMRLCTNTGFGLHIIEPIGFSLDAKSLKRAKLDYFSDTTPVFHKNFNDFFTNAGSAINACAIPNKSHIFFFNKVSPISTDVMFP